MNTSKRSLHEGCHFLARLSCTHRRPVKFAQVLTFIIMLAYFMWIFFHNFWLFEISQGPHQLLNLSFRWSLKPNREASHMGKLHEALQHCVEKNGDGLRLTQIDLCNLRIQYPKDTPNSWVYVKSPSSFKVRESRTLTWSYNLCEVLIYWKEAWTRGAMMTKDMLDCYLNDKDVDQVMYHIVSGGDCEDKEACIERVRAVLPQFQRFAPSEALRCALVGNSANLISNVSLADEIDNHDTIIRLNDARTDEAFLKWSGKRTTIRFINERVIKALNHIIKKNKIKSEIIVLRRALGWRHISKNITSYNDIQVSAIVQEQHGGFKADKILGFSSGYLALNLAASICKTVDLYGFSIDPGPQSSWTRYFSNPRFGHSPLRHKAYYHLLECLRVVSIKSTSRLLRNKIISLPEQDVIENGYDAASSFQRKGSTHSNTHKPSCDKRP